MRILETGMFPAGDTRGQLKTHLSHPNHPAVLPLPALPVPPSDQSRVWSLLLHFRAFCPGSCSVTGFCFAGGTEGAKQAARTPVPPLRAATRYLSARPLAPGSLPAPRGAVSPPYLPLPPRSGARRPCPRPPSPPRSALPRSELPVCAARGQPLPNNGAAAFPSNETTALKVLGAGKEGRRRRAEPCRVRPCRVQPRSATLASAEPQSCSRARTSPSPYSAEDVASRPVPSHPVPSVLWARGRSPRRMPGAPRRLQHEGRTGT